MSWLRVTWTEADQILVLCDAAGAVHAAPPSAGTDPKTYFDRLVVAGALDRAVAFIGAALPRREAVQWAAKAVGRSDLIGHSAPRAVHHDLNKAVQAWLTDPDEDCRRAAWSAASRTESSSPEKLLACAIFFSGGSIAPEDCEPVQPMPHLCGRLAATAVIASAYASDNPDEHLRFAVAEGDRFAST